MLPLSVRSSPMAFAVCVYLFYFIFIFLLFLFLLFFILFIFFFALEFVIKFSELRYQAGTSLSFGRISSLGNK